MGVTVPKLLRSAALVFCLTAACVIATAQTSPGAAIFTSKCTMCHGADGSGKTMMGEKLKAADLRSPEIQKKSDAQLKEIIVSGKAKMPAFRGKLSPEQIDQVLAEIREMGKTK